MVKMPIILKAINGFNVIPIKNFMVYFTEIELSSKIHVEPQKTLNSQGILEKRKQSWSHHISFQSTLQNYSDKISMVLA